MNLFSFDVERLSYRLGDKALGENAQSKTGQDLCQRSWRNQPDHLGNEDTLGLETPPLLTGVIARAQPLFSAHRLGRAALPGVGQAFQADVRLGSQVTTEIYHRKVD